MADGFIDNVEGPEESSLAADVILLRQRLRSCLLTNVRELKQVVEIVERQGRAEVVAALNAIDAGYAAVLNSIFRDLRTATNNVFDEGGSNPKPNLVVPDLPAAT